MSDDYSYRYNTKYQYDHSGRLVREYLTEYDAQANKTTREFIYLYDETGMIGVMYNSIVYYYLRNLQGDVIAIYDASGEKKVEYAYDAWGNCTIVYAEDLGFANANPIRYRGYYFDRETGLYYLNARYYSPEWRRFISPDDTEYIDSETPNGLNLYAYCGNDPLNRIDPLGCDWWNPFTWDWQGAFNSIGTAFSEAGQWLNSNVLIPVGNFFVDNWDIVLGVTATIGIAALGIATFGFANIGLGMLIGGIVGAGFGALNAYIAGDSVLYGAILGGIVGALSGIGNLGLKGMMFAGVASALGAATASLVSDRINNRPRNFKAAGLSAVTAGVFSFMGNGYGNYLSSMGPELAVKIAGNSMGAFYFSSYIFVADYILNKALGG